MPFEPPRSGEELAAQIGGAYDSSGGAGVDLEIHVVADALSCIIANVGHRALPLGVTIDHLHQQRRTGPRGFDDLILSGEDVSGLRHVAYVQVRRQFTIGDNDGFAPLARAILAHDQAHPDTPWSAAIVSDRVSPAITDADSLVQAARTAVDAEDFFERWRAPGTLNANKRKVLRAVRDALGAEDGPEVWRVLKRLILLEMDFGLQASRDNHGMVGRLAGCVDSDGAGPVELRDALRSLALGTARLSAAFDRAGLIACLGTTFAFAGSASHRKNLARILAESTQALATIETKLGEVTLLRPEVFDEARRRLAQAPALRLTGEAGCGKSGALARLAAGFSGPVVLIKEDRVGARNWSDHAQRLGADIGAADLIDELGGSGRALLAIDGADRLLLSERRGVVQDLLTAIAARPAGTAWKILTSARTLHGQDIVRDALMQFDLPPGVQMVVDVLDQNDIGYVAGIFPKLAPLVWRDDLGGRNHELFTLREHLDDPDAGDLGAEIASARRWATRGSRTVPPRPERDAAIAQIATLMIDQPGRAVGRGEVDPQGLQVLIHDGHVRVEPHQDAVTFSHDVYEDWALARALARDWRDLPKRLLDARQPLWWLRAVRLSAQIILETSGLEDWREMLDRVTENPDLDPAWARTILTAVLYSEQSATLLTRLEPILLAQGAQLLDRFIETLVVLETRPADWILASSEMEEAERLRMAAALPQPTRSWRVFLHWSVRRWSNWPPRLYPRLAKIAEIWLRATEGYRLPISKVLVEVCRDWLVEIEDAHRPSDGGASRDPFGDPELGYGGRRDLEKELRTCLTLGATANPPVVEAYLDRLSSTTRRRVDVEELIKAPRRIPSVLPRAYVDVAIVHFAPTFKRTRDPIRMTSRWSSLDYSGLRHGFGSATPIAYGFDQLFEADPEQALRLLRKLEKRASVSYRHSVRRQEGRRARPVIIQFPWGRVPLWGDENTYRWARGALGPSPLGSIYMALDLWMAKQAEQGRSLDSLFRQVLKPHGLNATLAPCIALAVEHMNAPGQMDHVGPILAEPRVWNHEVRRFTDDQTLATQPLMSPWDHGREEVLKVGARYAKRQHIRVDLIIPFLLFAGDEARAAFHARVATWTGEDLADFSDQLENPETRAAMDAQIERYRVDTRQENLKLTETDAGLRIDIEPDPATAEQIAPLNAYNVQMNALMGLVVWVRNSLDNGAIDARQTLVEAIAKAKEILDGGAPAGEDQDFARRLSIEGVFGVLAVLARFGDDDLVARERGWMMGLLAEGPHFAPSLDAPPSAALMFSDPALFATKALGTLISRDPDDATVMALLVEFAVNPAYALTAAAVASIDFDRAPRAGWAVLWAAIHRCVYVRLRPWQTEDKRRLSRIRRRAQHAIAKGLVDMDRAKPRRLVLPPKPHVRKLRFARDWRRPVSLVAWPADLSLDRHRAEKVFQVVPVASLAARPEAARALADYLGRLGHWIRQRCEGPSHKWREDAFPFELGRELGMMTGRLAVAWPGPGPAPQTWRALTLFKEREHAVDLMGEVLQGMTDALLSSKRAPDEQFWSVWDPVSNWVLDHGKPRWSDRWDAVGAAGFMGPYASPLPPDWPHLDLVLPRIDLWVRRVGRLERQARAMLKFCDRFTPEQTEAWAMPWIEHIVVGGQTDDSFWEDEDLPNRAAVILDGLLARRPALATRLRPTLATLADRGSLAARQTLVRLGSRRQLNPRDDQ
jgi:hypothetical protein